jgi:hypothetical protein
VTLEDKNFRNITGKLQASGIKWALGGSGLIFNLGLCKDFSDWDITTQAPQVDIKTALKDIPYRALRKTKLFQSDYCLRFSEDPKRIDLIGGFRLQSNGVKYSIPMHISAVKNEIPLASPEWWFCAYWLMGELAKSELLFQYVKRNGADMRVLSDIVAMNWPASLKEKVRSLI